MKYIQAKSLLSKSNYINIYRGCTHGCIYCDSRSHCFEIGDFEDIQVKENAAVLLDKELSRKRKKIMIHTGAMSDPYLPIEKELELTRACLKVIAKRGFGVSIITKSDLVLRDIDILKEINKNAKCVVQMTLTTADASLCAILEPNVCSTNQRVEALKQLHEAGIPTIVWMTPILPYINDTKENIQKLLQYCIQAKVYGVLSFGIGMSLRPGSREFYYSHLNKNFPHLLNTYRKQYGSAYILKSPHHKTLYQEIRSQCVNHGILYREKDIFDYLNTFPTHHEQLTLF